MAPFAPEASLFVAMDHDVPLALAPVGPAGLVVAELLVRVHAALLLRTSLISKGASQRFAVRLNCHSLWHYSAGAGGLLGKGHASMVQVGQ
jgi:hypothetical protein